MLCPSGMTICKDTFRHNASPSVGFQSINQVVATVKHSKQKGMETLECLTIYSLLIYHLNDIADFLSFKAYLTAFILSVPDKPPVRGYTCPNSNSLLAWRTDSSASALWGGQQIWWPAWVSRNLMQVMHVRVALPKLIIKPFQWTERKTNYSVEYKCKYSRRKDAKYWPVGCKK